MGLPSDQELAFGCAFLCVVVAIVGYLSISGLLILIHHLSIHWK